MANDVDTTVGLFFEAGRAIRRTIEQGKAPLSQAQLEALRFVHEASLPSMRDVARYLHITAPSATALMQELVRKELVRRIPNPADRREVRLGTTSKGARVLQHTTALRKKALRSIFMTLSARDHKDLQRICHSILSTK